MRLYLLRISRSVRLRSSSCEAASSLTADGPSQRARRCEFGLALARVTNEECRTPVSALLPLQFTLRLQMTGCQARESPDSSVTGV